MSGGGKPYRPGDHLALCDICSRKFYGSELRKNYRGFMVCKDDYETRHPQESIKVKKERIKVDNPRPQTEDRFLEPGEVTAEDL